jgi:hypothetical protein
VKKDWVEGGAEALVGWSWKEGHNNWKRHGSNPGVRC